MLAPLTIPPLPTLHVLQSVRSRVAGIIAARLVTITPASWTPTDLVNWLLAAGQEALAAAALADGIGGADAAVFGIQPMMMVRRAVPFSSVANVLLNTAAAAHI